MKISCLTIKILSYNASILQGEIDVYHVTMQTNKQTNKQTNRSQVRNISYLFADNLVVHQDSLSSL